MAGLDRFERIMERAVEGSVGRVFRNQVQPAEIGRRLEQAMEARPLVSVNGTIVPNDYQVHLNPEDAAVFQPMQYELCQSFAQWLGEIGGERGYRFMGPINVSLMSDPHVARRDVQVQAAAQSPAPPLQAYVPPPPQQQAPPPRQMPPQAYVQPPAPTRERERELDSFTVRQRPQHDPHESETALASRQRPGMIAPVAGVPARMPPPNAPKGVVAFFALQSLAGERAYPLRFGDATIGRALDNDVVLESNDVSRRHARLEPAGSVLRLVDLGSTNGTRVNGRRVQEHLLHDGDLVEFGSVQLAFHVGDPTAR